MKRFILILLFLALPFVVLGCGSSGNTYKNSSKGFSMSFPVGWTESVEKGAHSAVTFSSPDRKANITVAIQKLPPSVTPDKYFGMVNERFKSTGKLVEQPTKININGVDGYKCVIGMNIAGQGVTSDNFSLMKGNKVYSIISTVYSGNYSMYKPIVEKAVNTFEIN